MAQRLERIPSSQRETYKKAVSGKSKALALKALCLECMGWDRVAVKNCTALACPLWPYRPGHGRPKRPLTEAQKASFSGRVSPQKRRSQEEEG